MIGELDNETLALKSLNAVVLFGTELSECCCDCYSLKKKTYARTLLSSEYPL